MKEFGIVLFAPSMPAQGHETHARFTAGHLVVDDHSVDIPLAEIGVTLGGSDHKQLYLFWHEEEGRWAIRPRDATAREALIASAPAPLDALLRHASRDLRRGRSVAMRRVALTLALLLLLAGILCWQSNRVTDWIREHIQYPKAGIWTKRQRQTTSRAEPHVNSSNVPTAHSIGRGLAGIAIDPRHRAIEQASRISALAAPFTPIL
ncbi:MAG: hypothetical protein ACLPXB_08120 [Thiobacillaceae bacterium]